MFDPHAWTMEFASPGAYAAARAATTPTTPPLEEAQLMQASSGMDFFGGFRPDRFFWGFIYDL